MVLEDFNIYYVNNWILIPAAFIILFLSYLEKRSYRADICGGRPALVIPLPFIDGYENRLAYSVAFGTITNTFVSLVRSEKTLDLDFPLWARALYIYLQAFIGCLTCFPFFACFSTRYRVVGAGICIVYSIVWLSLSVVNTVQDAANGDNATVWDMTLNDNVVNGLRIARAMLLGLPNILSYFLLICYCVYVLYRSFKTKTYYNKHTSFTLRPHQEEHVRWVFRKSKDVSGSHDFEPKPTFVQQMQKEKKLRLLKNLPFFKYPTKIIAMAYLQVAVIYWIGTLLSFTTTKVVYESIQMVKNTGIQIGGLDEHVIIIAVCGSIALFIAIVNSLIHIFVALRNYRYHLLKIYQGEKDFAVKFEIPPQYLLTNNMIYPGYQMSFMLWGCAISFGFVFLLLLIIVEGIYQLVVHEILTHVLLEILQLLGLLATMIVLFYLQVLLSKKVLLQDKLKVTDDHPPLNINNRKLYELVNYYSLFTNMAVGIFTCLNRIVLSAFFGVFAVSRLDKSVFTRDMETFDRGYKSYLCMLLVDNAHNNPSMRVFAHLLWTRTLARRSRERRRAESFNDKSPLTASAPHRHATNNEKGTHLDSPGSNAWTFCEIVEEFRMSSKSRRRWFLAYTLMKNPQLQKLRKRELAKTAESKETPESDGKEMNSFCD